MNRTFKRLAIPVGAAAILGTSGFAYMAGTTGPTTTAGVASGSIVSANIDALTYALYPAGAQKQYIQSATIKTNRPVAQSNQTLFITTEDGTVYPYSCSHQNNSFAPQATVNPTPQDEYFTCHSASGESDTSHFAPLDTAVSYQLNNAQ